MQKALGIIDAKGLTTAVAALDAASKAADVTLVGVERVIGGPNAMSVSIHIAGEVAAVKAAVDAGVLAGNRVGTIIASHVIPRPHDELDKLIDKFSKNIKSNKVEDNKNDSNTENEKSDKEE
jgi:ethanolamine utilization protein EutM